jgi:hypothetical protein
VYGRCSQELTRAYQADKIGVFVGTTAQLRGPNQMRKYASMAACLFLSLSSLALPKQAFSHPAFGHSPAPALPLHHAISLVRFGHVRPLTLSSARSASQLSALFFSKGSSKLFLRSAFAQANLVTFPGIRGPLSQSARTIINQYSTLVSSGVSQGEQLGVVSFGQLNGQVEYEQVSGSTYASDGTQINIFGNTPLNSGFRPGSFTVPNPGQNVLFFGGGTPNGVGGKGVAASLLPFNTITGSAATRAFINQYKYLARTSISMGKNLASHPIGGELAGTSYDGTGNNVHPDALFVSAFGQDPLNIPGLAINAHVNIPNPSSYLLLANGKKLFITSGQIFSTEYVPLNNGKFSIEGYSLFAIGKNPFNTGAMGPGIVINPKTIMSYLLTK